MDVIIKEEPQDAPESTFHNQHCNTIWCKVESGIENEFKAESEDFYSTTIKSEDEGIVFNVSYLTTMW